MGSSRVIHYLPNFFGAYPLPAFILSPLSKLNNLRAFKPLSLEAAMEQERNLTNKTAAEGRAGQT